MKDQLLLVSKQTHLSGWLAKPDYRCLLNLHRATILNRPELQFLGDSTASGTINSLKKSSTLKPLVTMACDSASTTTNGLQTVSSTQFFKVWINFCYDFLVHSKRCQMLLLLPQANNFKKPAPDKSTIRFKTGSYI